MRYWLVLLYLGLKELVRKDREGIPEWSYFYESFIFKKELEAIYIYSKDKIAFLLCIMEKLLSTSRRFPASPV